jgi:hypothetical protein
MHDADAEEKISGDGPGGSCGTGADECPACGKLCGTVAGLRRHVRRCPAPSDESYDGQAVIISGSSRKRPRTTGADNRYACDLCNVTFRLKSELQKHKRTAHGNTALVCHHCGGEAVVEEEGQFVCRQCGKHAEKFEGHTVKEESAGAENAGRDRALVCGACGKRYSRHNLYKQHVGKVAVSCYLNCLSLPLLFLTARNIRFGTGPCRFIFLNKEYFIRSYQRGVETPLNYSKGAVISMFFFVWFCDRLAGLYF